VPDDLGQVALAVGDHLLGQADHPLHPIYYDLDTTLRQLGVAWDPNTTWGRVATAVNHPITLRRALWRSLFRRRSR
jgi:hypothetical protein